MKVTSDNNSTLFEENTRENLLQYDDQMILTEEQETESQGHIY